jgi:hypothetical protein
MLVRMLVIQSTLLMAGQGQPSEAEWVDQGPCLNAPAEDTKQGRDRSELGIGPVVGTGLPSLVNFGLTAKLGRHFGLGVNVGLMPETTLRLYGEATIEYRQYEAYARVHPFAGAFFLGAAAGYAHASGSFHSAYDLTFLQISEAPDEFSVRSVANASAVFATPQLGFFQVLGPGFAIGLDTGLQIPVSTSDIEFETRVTEDLPPAAGETVDTFVSTADDQVRHTLEALARTPIPVVNLRIGWLF